MSESSQDNAAKDAAAPTVVRSPVRFEQVVHESVVHVPSTLTVIWDAGRESDGRRIERHVTSVELSYANDRGRIEAQTDLYRRGADGSLLKPPAADLAAAAAELIACKSLDDVCVLFTKIVSEGVK